MGASAVYAILATAMVANTAVSYQNGQDQKKAAANAAQQAKANALKQEKQADEANNMANRKQPDTAAILAAAQQSGKSGVSGTMLTGAQGVDPSALQLGKNTLLGV